MMTVVWTSETREIPGHGLAETGKEITLPDLLAERFVSQGQARWVKPKKSTNGGNVV